MVPEQIKFYCCFPEAFAFQFKKQTVGDRVGAAPKLSFQVTILSLECQSISI